MNLRTPPLPKYFQVASEVRELIENGQLTPGDQLPTEEALCEKHDVSRGTVRKALQLLIDDGIIETEQGRGSFVAATIHSSTYFSIRSFDEEMRRQQRKPSTRLLKFEKRLAGERTADRLTISATAPVWQIERLRLADQQPVAYECRILAEALCPQLEFEDLESQSIHWLLVEKYKIPLVKLIHTVERLPLTQLQADLLDGEVGNPAFVIDRLSFTGRGNDTVPAVLFEAVYREESYYLHAVT
ncbi:MAG: GntR family transcriptional regulator [Chloroflexota bacterium]